MKNNFANPEAWPEGTEIKETTEGKKEIILPRPTNMQEFDKAKKLKEKTNGKDREYKRPSHSGGKQGPNVKQLDERTFDDGKNAQKYYHTRQEQIKKERKQEREFKDRQQAA